MCTQSYFIAIDIVLFAIVIKINAKKEKKYIGVIINNVIMRYIIYWCR